MVWKSTFISIATSFKSVSPIPDKLNLDFRLEPIFANGKARPKYGVHFKSVFTQT